MICVLVGGPGHLRTYDVPAHSGEVVYPLPVENLRFGEHHREPPSTSIERATYLRMNVRTAEGRVTNRLFFFASDSDVTPEQIAEGLRRLRGAQIEMMP